MKGKKLSGKDRKARLAGDPTERRRIFKDICVHLSTGYSLDCFPDLAIECIQGYIKSYPDEFVQEELEEALRRGKVYWEGIGNRQARGDCLGNSRSWQYNMINRYRWSDRLEVDAKMSGSMDVSIVSYASTKASRDTEDRVDT